LEDLQNLEDIGPKVGGSIYEFFSNKENIHLLEQLEKIGLKLKNEKKDLATAGNLSGQTFLFTGTLPTLKRSDAEAMVEKNGGQLLGGVSAKLELFSSGRRCGKQIRQSKKVEFS
jgi:DNA ligase (NAD+)